MGHVHTPIPPGHGVFPPTDVQASSAHPQPGRSQPKKMIVPGMVGVLGWSCLGWQVFWNLTEFIFSKPTRKITKSQDIECFGMAVFGVAGFWKHVESKCGMLEATNSLIEQV